MNPNQLIFLNSFGETVPYDGSSLSWRVSAYSLILQDKQVFLVKSSKEKLYDLPGGMVEIGEAIEDTLKREALEEAGLIIQPQKFLSFHQNYFYHQSEKKFYQTLLLYFLSKPIGTSQTPTDPNVDFYQFVSISELDQYPLLDWIPPLINKNQ